MAEKTSKIKDERSRFGTFFVKRKSSGVFTCFKSILKYPEDLFLSENAYSQRKFIKNIQVTFLELRELAAGRPLQPLQPFRCSFIL